MSQRIFNACRKSLANRDYTKEELIQLAESLIAEAQLVSRIRREANLEIADEEESKLFSFSKVPAAVCSELIFLDRFILEASG